MERVSGRRRRRLLTAGVLAAATGLLPVAGGAATLQDAQAAVRPWWPAAMGFDDLQRGGTGKGITIAVLDGVIDPKAPDIRGRIASTESVCWEKDTTATTTEADHATRIAQLIVGTGAPANGMPGVEGIAPQATLRHYTVGYGEHLTCSPPDEKHLNGTATAIERALKAGAKIISMSYGQSSINPHMKRAMAEAQHAGAILVAAPAPKALDYPSGFNGVVAVNACDSTGKVSAEAAPNVGNGIAFCAPGVGMALGTHDKQGRWLPQGVVADGSSYAAPLVAGGLAAYWSKYPSATANQVLQAALHNPGMKQGTSTTGKKGWIWWYRREGSGFPKIVGTSRTGFGWGIFDAADLMSVDPTAYPDTNPLVGDGGIAGPTAQEIAAGRLLTSATASSSTTGTATATAAPRPSGSPGGGVTAPSSRTSGGVPAWVWVALVVLLASLVAGGAFMFTRRGPGARPVAQPGEGS